MKLVLGWIFDGYSLRAFTEFHPVLAAGGQLAHLPEPRHQELEADLGTVNKYCLIDTIVCHADSTLLVKQYAKNYTTMISCNTFSMIANVLLIHLKINILIQK